jgi:DnaK suppressor protein
MSTVTTARPPTAVLPAPAFEPFRTLLEAQRADCVRRHELARAETVTAVPDAVAMSRTAGLRRTIEEIDAALDRIAAGTYGACVHCGVAIPTERLELRPYAIGCVSCQQRAR